MVSYTCDRCKKNLDKLEKVYNISIPMIKKIYDLCSDCYTTIRNVIENKEVQEEKTI